jgi:hypothetical protein
MVKIGLVIWLLAMLPISLMCMAAAGPTTGDPEAGGQIAAHLGLYMALDGLTLFLIARCRRHRWVWAMAGVVALPPALFAIYMVR